MTGATLDLTTSIVNIRRLADKLERGEPIVLPRAVPAPTPAPLPAPMPAPVPAPVTLPSLPPPPVVGFVPPPPPPVAVDTPADDAEPAVVAGPSIVEEPLTLAPTFAIAPAIASEAVELDDSDLREGDLARLEQVRAELSELGGRRMSPWTRRRLEEAQVAEREILERLGFDSYLDVMLAYAAGSPQSEPGLAPSSKLPSLASFATLPSLDSFTASPAAVEEPASDGGVIDNGGSDEDSSDGGPSVHEIGERFEPAPIAETEPAPEPEPEVVPAPAGPSTIADWLRESSFAGARNELVDVKAGA